MTTLSKAKNDPIKWALRNTLVVVPLLFVIILTIVMLSNFTPYYQLQLYSNPFFDRTSTNDHLLSFVAFDILFFASVLTIGNKKTVLWDSICICALTFSIGNAFADNFILHYYWLYIFDYITPVIASLILIYLHSKKILGHIALLFFAMLPAYLLWNFLKIPIDCGAFTTWTFCKVNAPFFWNPLVNFWIVFVWACNFILGYLILTLFIRQSL